ncbi:MAG TPA: hypothetical protein VEG34_03920, partial [Thermoanaerobaculia bacterium]|nr:hypothetical protein [Thermoanaerobaculia bacterium]
GSTSTLRARHLVARGGRRALVRSRYGGGLDLTINYSNIDLGSGRVVNTGPGGGGISGNLTLGNRPGDPLFVSANDFRLAADSPAADIGGPDLLAPRPARDLFGAPRLRDGDGDGLPELDAGAFESQFPAIRRDRTRPRVARLSLRPARFAAGRRRTARSARVARRTTIRYRLSEAAAVRLAVQRRRGKRWRTVMTLVRKQKRGRQKVRFTGRVGKRRLRRGRYRLRVRATDPAGNRSKPRTRRFRVIRP